MNEVSPLIGEVISIPKIKNIIISNEKIIKKETLLNFISLYIPKTIEELFNKFPLLSIDKFEISDSIKINNV